MKGALTFLSAVVAASAAVINLDKRAVIDHDAVVALPQTVPSTTAGTLYLKYKPYLNRESGCDCYPAVDAEGNTSGGLEPTGDPTGDCLDSSGQIYARSTTYGDYFAIMYSWYWPKDEPSTGIGHRHDWESIVVWLSAESTSATIAGVAVSGHGGYTTSTSPNLSGTSPLIRYYNTWPLDHQLGFTSTVGSQQDLVAWESMSTVVQDALTNTDFGDANVPFKDANFENNLAEASL